MHWLSTAADLLMADTADLRALARIAGGDPRTFYVTIDIRRVDISGQDISGMQFLKAEGKQNKKRSNSYARKKEKNIYRKSDLRTLSFDDLVMLRDKVVRMISKKAEDARHELQRKLVAMGRLKRKQGRLKGSKSGVRSHDRKRNMRDGLRRRTKGLAS